MLGLLELGVLWRVPLRSRALDSQRPLTATSGKQLRQTLVLRTIGVLLVIGAVSSGAIAIKLLVHGIFQQYRLATERRTRYLGLQHQEGAIRMHQRREVHR